MLNSVTTCGWYGDDEVESDLLSVSCNGWYFTPRSVTPPVPVPVPPTAFGGYGGRMADDWSIRFSDVEKRNADDLELVMVLTEFLSRN